MYMTDREIQARLQDFQFESEFTDHPFDPANQIGPCSVDLRLGGVYWRPKHSRFRKKTVDLDRTRLMELRPERGWRKFELRSDEKLTIEPGQMVLGRVAERFRMPGDCAGDIEGRSSYARLGLSVHATGGFINPGWRGHMPLTLFNMSPVRLRIPAGTPLCQLLVVKLADAPDADYEARGDRKYLNDQGGPSYWWRDALIEKLRESFSVANIEGHVFEDLDELFADSADDGTLLRLEEYVVEQDRTFGSASDLLDGFAVSERRAKRIYETMTFAMQWAWALFATLMVSALLSNSALALKIISSVAFLVSLVGIYFGTTRENRQFLTPDKLQDLERARNRQRSAPTNSPPTTGQPGEVGPVPVEPVPDAPS